MSAELAAEELAQAASALEAFLHQTPYAAAIQHLGSHATPEAAHALLEDAIHPGSGSTTRLQSVLADTGAFPDQILDRTILMLAALHAAPRVPALPLGASMQRMFAEELRFLANPPAFWVPFLQFGNVRFLEIAKILCFQRFPVGQFHWEMSAFPRSWLFRSRRALHLGWFLARRLHGFGPLFELHVNARRKNRLVLTESEQTLCYLRVAETLRLQPAVKGVMTASWLFCADTARVTPRLSWLRSGPLAAGGAIFELGDAAADSGFMVGSSERRSLFESGKYHPTVSCLLWPREDILAWAETQKTPDTI